MPHRSPARNMPSPRGYVSDHLPPDIPPRDDVPWPIRRTVQPPSPYLPSTLCTATSASRAVPKFSAAASGPPPLIHELVKGVSGGGSIVLGTPLSPEQRRRHFELPPTVGMLYKGGNDPNVLRSGFTGPLIAQPPPPPPQDGQFPIIARQTGVPWQPGHVQQSVIRASGDGNVATSSRDLLYGDLLTARQMHRTQVAAPADTSADRRWTSPRSTASYVPPSWQHASRSGRNDPPGPQYLDDIRRADVLNTMLPWPVRPPANITRYSVCGEPSRQCYTPPLPIHKAFVSSRDAVPGSFQSGDRPSRHDNADAAVPGRFQDPNRGGGPKISPHYKDSMAENIAEWRRIDVRHSPITDAPELSSGGSHRPDNKVNVEAPAVTTAQEQLTAANLIDAIIIEQINQDTPMTAKPLCVSPGQPATVASSMNILERLKTDTSTCDQSTAVSSAPMLCSPTAADKHHQSQKPSPGDTAHSSRTDLTLGEHIHSIIMHDFKQKDGSAADASAFETTTSIGKIWV